MAVLRDLSILWSLFHILILFILLYRSRFSRRTTILATALCMGPLIVFQMWGIAVYGVGIMAKYLVLTCTIPSLVFYFIMSKDRGGRFFFTFCLADTFSLWVLVITNLADYYLGGGYVLMFVSRLLIFPVAEILVWRYLRAPYLEVQQGVTKGWAVFACMAALYYLLLAVMANWPNVVTSRPHDMPAMGLVLLLMPLTYLTIFGALYRQLLLFRTQENDRMLAAQKAQLEAQLVNQRYVQELHHNMKAFCNTLSGLLADGKLDDARAFLAESGNMSGGAGTLYCRDSYLNAVLSQFAGRFQAAGAGLTADVRLGDDPLPHTELCLILSNALDNALEAVAALPEGEREASVQIRLKGVYLLLRVKNRCAAGLAVERGSFPGTTKQELGHGYGLPTIRRTAEGLGGSAVCYTEGGYFFLDVMVRL